MSPLRRGGVFWGLIGLDRFYNGGARERDILTRAYLRLIKHVNSIYKVPPLPPLSCRAR